MMGLKPAENAVVRSIHFGGERLDFVVAGCRAFMIKPTRPAEDGSRPWLWFAPTFMGPHPDDPAINPDGDTHPDDSHAWMFTRFLDRGFHIGGVEIGESYGSPPGRTLFTRYYEHVVATYGLAPRVCLLPQSRGGLMLYNWTAEHPDWVACIGCIYPVTDMRTYPGLARACGAYGMTEAELAAHLAEHNPIGRLAALAKAGVPFFAIHGDSDTLVPLEANSALLKTRYTALGGSMQLVAPPGQGHNMLAGFFQSEELVKFVTTHAKP
jgi:hypothetical protein